jgi:hypothetical protein
VADSVTTDWYYAKRGAPHGQQAGPFTWEQLFSHARAGAVAPDDLVWHPQLPQWLPAGQVSGLFPAAAFPGGPGPYPPDAAQPGAPYQPYAGQLPASSTGRGRSWLAWVIPLVALLLVGAGIGLVLVLTHGDNDKGSTASTRTTLPAGSTGSTVANQAAFTQGEGEVFLEVAGTAGPDSFAGAALLVDHAVTSPTSIPPITPVSTLPGMPVQIASYSGGTPGLYGGSRSKLIADKEAQLKFLQDNLDKAKAFCAALNADPTLRWSGGTQVKPEQLAAYFAELTPLMLIRDTRVTNNGFRNGQPTPRQSVLQAGQMVLVDLYGVPRARCECGNPLTLPKPVETPTYTGPRWPAFDPTAIVIIEQAAAIIDSFAIVDVDTGDIFERPAGTSGGQDAATTTTTTTTTVDTSGPVEEFFSVSSIGAAYNGATPATFTIDQAWYVTVIHTYHWNDGQGASPGTIGLRAADGTMYGPWQATGSDGQGGVPNANWTVNPNIVIPPGDYTVIDSDPGTWAQNGETNGAGMSYGSGIRQGNP